MTLRLVSTVLLAAITVSWAVPAHAEGVVTKFTYDVVRGWKRNNFWPRSFNYPDRQASRAPFVTMVHNGWRQQNLLSQYHFDTDTGTLSPAGQEKLRWILLQAPQQHRTVYVGRASTAEQTATRIGAVHKLASQILPEGQIPAVMETDIVAGGWSAERIDTIGRKFQDSTPEPRLPTASSSGESP